jgi:hypothetical protein
MGWGDWVNVEVDYEKIERDQIKSLKEYRIKFIKESCNILKEYPNAGGEACALKEDPAGTWCWPCMVIDGDME